MKRWLCWVLVLCLLMAMPSALMEGVDSTDPIEEMVDEITVELGQDELSNQEENENDDAQADTYEEAELSLPVEEKVFDIETSVFYARVTEDFLPVYADAEATECMGCVNAGSILLVIDNADGYEKVAFSDGFEVKTGYVVAAGLEVLEKDITALTTEFDTDNSVLYYNDVYPVFELSLEIVSEPVDAENLRVVVVSGDETSSSDKWDSIQLFNQGWIENDEQDNWRAIQLCEAIEDKYKDDSGYLTLGNIRRRDGKLSYGSGCGLYTYAYAIQWLIRGKQTGSNAVKLLNDVVNVCKPENKWPFSNKYGGGTLSALHSYILSLGAIEYKSSLSSPADYENLFDQGGVIIAHPNNHYALAVDLDYSNNVPYVHIIDSSCKSTISRIGYNAYSKNFDKITVNNYSNHFPDNGYGYKGGEYYVPFDEFTSSLLKDDSYRYLPPSGSSGSSSLYRSSVLYVENCTYKAVKKFNWHKGPSAKAEVVGTAAANSTFTTDAVVWNTTTNNMWLKKRGEEKYVFAGYHWDGSKWFLDNSQTQYLQFISDNKNINWNNCNIPAAHKQGSKLALQGELTSDTTMLSVTGEFYKDKSCWEFPTSAFSINGTSYPMYNSGLDNALKFGNLPASNDVSLVLTIKYLYNRGQKTGTYVIEKPFTVTGSGSSSSTPSSGKSATYEVITPDGLNVRSGPGTNYGIITTIWPGTTIAITQTQAVGSATWGKGKTSTGITGWISLSSSLVKQITISGTAHIAGLGSVNPTGITLDKSISIVEGRGVMLKATLTPTNAKKDITWSSSKTSVATVDGNGVVKGIKKGTAKITAKTANGKTATCTVKVTAAPKLKSVKLNRKGTVELGAGSKLALSATLTPSGIQAALNWSSSKPNVATVSDNGVVTGIKEGTTTITVKANNKKATVKIKVIDPYAPKSIVLAEKKATIKVGGSYTVRWSLTPSTARTNVTFKSSKTSVATVDANGVIRGIKKGSATITATTANGKKATIKITVKQ